jgi:hypothetical protein|nr:MAG TPA: Protein of unknown function (DUF3094) [Caudoviricetes sp.]
MRLGLRPYFFFTSNIIEREDKIMKKLFGYSDETQKRIDDACDAGLNFLKWIFTMLVLLCIAGMVVLAEIIMKLVEVIF